MNESNRKTYNEIITSMTAGALAGAVAKTTIAPLDRTKIHFQVSKDKQFSFNRALRHLSDTVKHDGVAALWRGNSATMVRVVPYAAIQFTAHEQWKKVLHVDRAETPYRRFLAGSLAGVTGTVFTYPLDLARARLAITTRKELAIPLNHVPEFCISLETYSGLYSVFLTIWRKHGLRGLYHGILPTLYGSVMYAGCSFFTFETLKIRRKEYSPGPIAAYEKFAFGAMAGAMSQSSSYPLDIIRRRYQTGRGEGLGVIRLLFKIAQEEGVIRGLYKGLSMNWIKGPVAVGISFTTFDTCLQFLRLLPIFRSVTSDQPPGIGSDGSNDNNDIISCQTLLANNNIQSEGFMTANDNSADKVVIRRDK